jgi:glutaredoxin 3
MKITVYSTTTCPYCVMLKQWLDEKQVQYTEYMVDKNPYAAQMMAEQSEQRGVPFSTIEHDDGTVDRITGFDRTQFEASLARRK